MPFARRAVAALVTLAAVLPVGLSLSAPATALADDSFQPDGEDFLFAAGGGRVLSTFDDAAGRVRLQEGFGSAVRVLPVRPVSPRAGIDVGTDASGRAVAVYGRCPAARRCDLFAYSFSGRRERRLGVSRRACSEVGPRIDRGAIVFRRFERRSLKRARRCEPGLFQARPGRSVRRVMRPAPDDYDYAGALLAFQRPVEVGSGDDEVQGTFQEVRVLRIGDGPSRLIARDTALSHPRLTAGLVHWISEFDDFSSGDRVTTADIVRAPVGGGGPFAVLEREGRRYVGERAKGGDRLFGLAVDGDRLLYEFANGIGQVAPGPPPFGQP